MQRTLKWLSALHILVFSLSGCELSPDVVICEDGTPPVLGTPATIQEIPTKLGPPMQLFTYDPAQENTFTSTQGTAILIPANAFVNENGQPITTPVHLEMREVFNKADMVLAAMPTISNGRILESAGELYLSPQEKVKWADGKTIEMTTTIPPSVTSMNGMRLFSGASNPTVGCFNWDLVLDTGSALAVTGQALPQAKVTISSTLLNTGATWINIDKFLPEAPKDTIVANIPGDPVDVAKNTMAFALIRDRNSVLRLCDSSEPGTLQTPGIPLGTAVSVVVIRTLNSKMYFGRTNTIVDGKKYLTPNILEITPEALVDSLKLLK
ncbi:hypothetical protein [Hymenobacter sp. DG25A]|uniref:hypothetical protein n=1 Tax=Hymenobacter sp. DG25A TaxID=1385663 RepID=UPI000B0C42DD|nr:hypothetical protein [Hymenobacter sp. DG25A]